MTTDELDLKRRHIGVMAILVFNVGCLLTILDKDATDWPLWIAVLLLSLSLPALSLSAYFVLVFGEKALEFSSFVYVTIVGQILGFAVIACVFFHFSWIAGTLFLVGSMAACNCEMVDCLNNGVGDEAAENQRLKDESEADP